MDERPCEATGMVDLGPLNRIPLGEGRVFSAGEVKLAVFRRRDGKIFALQAQCPHRQGPLADGLIGGDTLVCPMHSFKFALSTGEPIGNECRALRTYPVEVGPRGEILVKVGAG
jgi:nitrite reductase (NADH) small subunit